MNDWEEMGKNLLLIMWCIYVTIMTVISLFNVESLYEAFVALIVWMFMIIIPVGIRGQ